VPKLTAVPAAGTRRVQRTKSVSRLIAPINHSKGASLQGWPLMLENSKSEAERGGHEDREVRTLLAQSEAGLRVRSFSSSSYRSLSLTSLSCFCFETLIYPTLLAHFAIAFHSLCAACCRRPLVYLQSLLHHTATHCRSFLAYLHPARNLSRHTKGP
jgi:hypothetical protein